MAVLEKPTDIEWCPDHDAVFMAFMRLLPRGRAWQTRDIVGFERDSTLKRIVSGLALEWTNFEQQMCLALDQWFCYAATIDLDAWELDYGIPDNCDLYNASVCSKVEAQHSVSPEDLIKLLQADGYTSEGRWLTGDDPEYPGVKSTFRIVVDPYLSPAFLNLTHVPFHLGQSRRLGAPVDPSQIRCMLERYIPAHCVVDVALSGVWDPFVKLASKIKGAWIASDLAPISGELLSWPSHPVGMTPTGTAGTGPTIVVDSLGVKRVNFNGTTQFLNLTGTGTLPIGTTPSEIWASGVQPATSLSRWLMQYGNPSGNAMRGIGRAAGGVPSHFDATFGVASIDDVDNAFDGGFVVSAYHDGAQLVPTVNGRPTSPPNMADATLNTGNTRLRIGASAGTTASNFWQGPLRAIFNFTPLLTVEERFKMQGWLAWDNGTPECLPGDHPYRNMRP